ncbi:MAG: hypothetical protein RIQ62_1642 [Bacteroidota bacterium]|jgi:hypothetical protein
MNQKIVSSIIAASSAYAKHFITRHRSHNRNIRTICFLGFLLCCSISLQAQELTLYVIPSKKTLNFQSPRRLMLSLLLSKFAKTAYPEYSHPVGHIIIELSDSNRSTLTGMVASSLTPLTKMVCLQGYGLSTLFAASPGYLREGKSNRNDIEMRYPAGDIAYIRFALQQATFDTLWQYLQQYKQRGYDTIYNGLNKPREGKGANCSAFAVSFIELGALLSPEYLRSWQIQRHISLALMGRTESDDSRVSFFSLLLRKGWARPHEATKVLLLYDPSLMFAWIQDQYRDQSVGNHSLFCTENRQQAKGLFLDCTQIPVPKGPTWLDHQISLPK